MYQNRNTPRWNVARFTSKCSAKDCQTVIKPGQKYFYYPADRVTLCTEHGLQADRDLAAADFDERGY